MSTPTGIIISNSTDIEEAGTEIRAENWHKMSLSKLWDQHVILNKRLMIAQQLRKQGMVNSISFGIDFLNELIKKKDAESDKANLM
jgi:hypothetical protein